MNIFQEIMNGTEEVKEPVIVQEEQKQEGIIKQAVEIKGELSVYDFDLESINTKIKEAETVEEITPEISTIKKIEAIMADAKAQFKKQVDEALKSFDKKQQALNDTIDIIKDKAIKQAQKTLIVKTKMVKKVNNETGEVYYEKKSTKEYDLPSGLSFRAGSVTYDYDEKQIEDDKFYKKTLKKTEVKKAVEKGELSEDVRTPKKGDPSVSIDRLKIGAYAKAMLEAKKDEENK